MSPKNGGHRRTQGSILEFGNTLPYRPVTPDRSHDVVGSQWQFAQLRIF